MAYASSECSSVGSSGSSSQTRGGISERKKELNRIAATKYREKKRVERESTTGELRALETRNIELRGEVSSIEAEIRYLKKLIAEIESRTKTKVTVAGNGMSAAK